ncbi:hypothetical protein [Cellulosimicrobium marinum]|uniref:hypothetical protein n=1 Tax=Cellulosimicrobium marinum TaxID=1638992 RepID=UPI0035569F41
MSLVADLQRKTPDQRGWARRTCTAREERDWYAASAAEYVWSRAVLAEAGIVEPVPVSYRALGARLAETARALDTSDAAWDRRLVAIKRIAES